MTQIKPATLSAVNRALSEAYSALLPLAQDEHSEKRKGMAWTACASIQRAQKALVRDTRP